MPAYERLSLPLGEAIFSQRAIRRFQRRAIAGEDLRLILEAAGRAPSARNLQPWHFLVIEDARLRREFQDIFQADWWLRRGRDGIRTIEDVPEEDRPTVDFLGRLAEAPALILACAIATRVPNEVLAAAQNLLLAARGLGIGGTLMRFGHETDPATDARVRQLFGMPDSARVEYIIPLGYPQGSFGPVQRKPLDQVVSLDTWGAAAPFAR